MIYMKFFDSYNQSNLSKVADLLLVFIDEEKLVCNAEEDHILSYMVIAKNVNDVISDVKQRFSKFVISNYRVFTSNHDITYIIIYDNEVKDHIITICHQSESEIDWFTNGNYVKNITLNGRLLYKISSTLSYPIIDSHFIHLLYEKFKCRYSETDRLRYMIALKIAIIDNIKL